MENGGNSPVVTGFPYYPSCEKSVPNSSEMVVNRDRVSDLVPALHNFHMSFTGALKEDWTEWWKNKSYCDSNRDLTA